MTTNDCAPLATNRPLLDFTTCDREPVQFPGAIMPHGLLVLLAPATWAVRGLSANTAVWCGCDPTDVITGGLRRLLAAESHQRLIATLAQVTMSATPQYLGCYDSALGSAQFDAFTHQSGDVIVLELERLTRSVQSLTLRFAAVNTAVAALQQADTWLAGMASVTRALKQSSGFDAVHGVRFLPDGSGLVVAEAHDDCYPSYLDLRFPRSDIPEPARQQMLLMPVHYAPDLTYQAVPLVLADPSADPRQRDLGHALLRSISPMCSQFYLNMGVQARLVLTIRHHGALWGFFSCWHRTTRTVPYADRLAYHTLAEMTGLLLAEKQAAEQQAALLATKRSLAATIAALNTADNLTVAAHQLPAQVLTSVDVTGVALCLGQQVLTAGEVPPEAFIRQLLPWLDQQAALFVTDQLPTDFAPAAAHSTQSTGLLAARLLGQQQYLLAFRPEWVHEVRWAGDPQKPIAIDLTNGMTRLTPRGSFAVWQQDVRGRARPWQLPDSEGWAELQHYLTLAQHHERQRELRTLLERSNSALEAFAYVVSHDLQEPLRGIRNFSYFLREQIGERLEGQERGWLETIMKLTARMTDQIQALLQYSRAGQQPVAIRQVDIAELLQTVLDALSARIHDSGARVMVAADVPTIACDPIRTAAIFENLITNGIKYNERADKQIEIGVTRSADNEPVFFVRDNGIGIAERHQTAIFTIFRRLHGRDEYGGGTGAGLTIAQKHVEQHGGRLWVESTLGQGSTFYFTLAMSAVTRRQPG